MLTVQKMLVLRKVALFSSLRSSDIGHLASIAEEVVFPSGSVIFSEGDFGDALYLIVEGEVRIHNASVTLNRLRAADYFGEMTLLDGVPRSATATADADCLVLRIRQGDFQAILARDFEVVLAIMRNLCERIRRGEAREREAIRSAAAAHPGRGPLLEVRDP